MKQTTTRENEMNYLEPTPGEWAFVEEDKPFGGDFYEPPDPGYPPTVWAKTDRGDIELAQLVVPIPEDAAYDDESGEPEWMGNTSSNGKLMAAAPDLLDSLKDMVEMFDVGPMDPRYYLKERARDLINKLNFEPQPRRSIKD